MRNMLDLRHRCSFEAIFVYVGSLLIRQNLVRALYDMLSALSGVGISPSSRGIGQKLGSLNNYDYVY
jgi:hypothetical protein